MPLNTPTPPPFALQEWEKQPFWQRAQAAIQAFGVNGNGSPPAVYLFYGVKMLLYVLGYVGLRILTERGPAAWSAEFWFANVAYQKAVAYTMLFEVLGCGCGSGPLTGRIKPMIGAFRHWLRPGTSKLPLFPRIPFLGDYRRTWLDVALYVALLGFLATAVLTATPGPEQWWPVICLVPLLGVLDKPIFLAARAEHYWVMMVTFVWAEDWIAAAMIVQLAMWFFAGVSKLNAHFPSVVAVMTSNSPTASRALKRSMYRDYPRDMRPSKTAVRHAILGTALELALPCVALVAVTVQSHTLLVLAMALAFLLHGFILSNVPIGVPLEWNLMMLYGAFFFFWAHPETTPLSLQPSVFLFFLLGFSVFLPLLGNFLPERVSFLLAMRYYAGNWPVSVYLFRRGCEHKLARVKKAATWPAEQIRASQPHLSEVQVKFMTTFSQTFRLMHLHGRAVHSLVPQLVDSIEDYQWFDGDIIAGLVLGWNFGEGHLHHEAFLKILQDQCDFDEGELRCLFLEALPLFGTHQHYRLHDAKRGLLKEGRFAVAEMRRLGPWPEG